VPLLKRRLTFVVILALMVAGCAAARSFRRGEEASSLGNWDEAVAEYTKAVQENPDKTEYKIALERATQNAARDHIARARDLESKDQLDAALLEYHRAVELDGSNRLAAARAIELEKIIRDRIEATRPKPAIDKLREEARRTNGPLLSPTAPLPVVSFGPNASVRDILNFIGTATGINVTYDQAYQDKAYTVRLEDVTLEQALQQIMAANQLFYKILNPKTIIVVPDNAQKHAQYDDLVVRVFYISHADVAELAQVLNTVMRIPTMPVQPTLLPNKTANTITVRATAPIVDVIERIIRANDKPRAEVVVDVQILEVNKNRAKTLGLNLNSYALGLTLSPEVAPPNTPATNPPTSPPPFNLNTISQGISTADFYLSIPTAVVNFLASDSHTKIVAKPQLRGAEGTKLTMNLGDEIPVLSTVFGAAAAGGFASVPQSSFNYRTVGIILEMTPRVTYDGEIVLDGFSVESSALGATISVAGQDVPSFASRKVTTKLRLREGESTLLAGLLKDEQRTILTGFPGLIRTPVLRSLFGQTNEQVNQSDIVMLLTPHIVRTHELTVQDLSSIYIGTQQNIGLGGPPPLIAPAPDGGGANPPGGSAGAAPGGALSGGALGGVPPNASSPPGAAGGVAGGVPGVTGVPSGTGNAPPANPPLMPPAPAGAVPPPFQGEGGQVPGSLPAVGQVPGAPTVGLEPPAGVPIAPATPPRDPNATPPAPPGAAGAGPTSPAAAQILVTPPGTEFRVAGGPYTVPLSINNASRISVITLTVTFNPNVLRVRTVQDGTFMRQGSVPTTFTPRVDASAGRVDIAVTRTADQAGASGAGLIAALLFDAVGPGGSLIQVSGVASTPEGAPASLQFSPVTVTVR
jgi:general secretion pathway protein D